MGRQPPDWAIDDARLTFRRCPHALPSVSLAQTAWESAWFTATTGRYNFGGVKAMASHPFSIHSTHEVIGGIVKAVPGNFRDFGSPAEYFDAHGDILEHSVGCREYRAALLTGGPLRAVYLFGGGTAAHPRYATGNAQAYGDGLASIIRAGDYQRFDR